MNIGKKQWLNYERATEKEWLMANGRSGFCGSTVVGANSRKYHGLLIGALSSPEERYLILSKLCETLIIEGEEYPLSTTKYEDKIDEGYKYQQSFYYDGIPMYRYLVKDTIIDKKIVMEYKKNTVIVEYTINNGVNKSSINIEPWMCFKKPEQCNKEENLRFIVNKQKNGFHLKPMLNKNIDINIFLTEVETIVHTDYITNKVFYDVDIATGDNYLDNFYVPGIMKISLEPYEVKKLYLVCTIEKEININPQKIMASQKERINKFKAIFNEDRILAKYLPLAADSFIVERDSIDSKTVLAGYPWFLDWGRDTMIALVGLTMVTNRLDDAKSILKSFSIYEKDGLIPNMFPHNGQDPIYNTVDASLWYVHAVYNYVLYSNNAAALDFVNKEIYPTIKNIINAYEKGTKFNIKMDEDGLISAGSGLDQVTWMDVRFDDIVVTPRHGKPVEINALWYNALKIAALLDKKFGGEDFEHYEDLSQKVKKSFNEKFWNEKEQCLYDVIKNDSYDDSIRPNQIWATSLPFTILSKEKEKLVVNKVFENLYTPYGLRSLSKDHKDYHGIYSGKLQDRDMAYHQGTVWAFPIGAFFSAYCKVNDYHKETMEFVNSLLRDLETHMEDQCLGTIAEIFDGDSPHLPRGCYSQAWSVGEILRFYYECILGNIHTLNSNCKEIFSAIHC